MENVKTKENFNQVCVWPGTVVGEDEIENFIKFIKDEFGVRAQYLEEIKTLPDTFEDGTPIEGTGDRNDLFFAIHKDDIGKFCIPRIQVGIRWLEDVLAKINQNQGLYPERVAKYKTWETE